MSAPRSDRPRLFLTRCIPEPGYSLAHRVFRVTGGEQDRPLARELLARFHVPGVRIKVDVDPVYFM